MNSYNKNFVGIDADEFEKTILKIQAYSVYTLENNIELEEQIDAFQSNYISDNFKTLSEKNNELIKNMAIIRKNQDEKLNVLMASGANYTDLFKQIRKSVSELQENI